MIGLTQKKKEMVNLMTSSSQSKWIKSLAVLYVLANLIMPFVAFYFLNVRVWNISFNPVDFVLKPLIVFPITILLLTLLLDGTRYAFYSLYELSQNIKQAGSILPFKATKKNLPIYIIDETYFTREFQSSNSIVVDMRIKDRANLVFHDNLDVVKLYTSDNQVNIPYLIEKANLLIRRTAILNQPIIFIVDSKKERSRTISRLWLKLICNPKSRSAQADIHTILKLVY